MPEQMPRKVTREFLKSLPPWVLKELRKHVEEEQGEAQRCFPLEDGNMCCNFTWNGITPVRNASGKPRVFKMKWHKPPEQKEEEPIRLLQLKRDR
jgi:hypothetical protein